MKNLEGIIDVDKFYAVWEPFTTLLIPCQEHVCVEWHQGVNALRLLESPLDFSHFRAAVNKAGGDIQYTCPLKINEWFILLSQDFFPIYTNVRSPESAAQSDAADAFHDLFGHLPYLIYPAFNATCQWFGRCWVASNKERQASLIKLWFYLIEFGVLAKGDRLYAFGGGLITSNYILRKFISHDIEMAPYNLPEVLSSNISPSGTPEKLFIFNSVEEILSALAISTRYVIQEADSAICLVEPSD